MLRRRRKELLNGSLCGTPGAKSHVLEPRQTFFIRRHLSVFGSSKGHMNFQVPGASLLGTLARLLECKAHQREEGHCQGYKTSQELGGALPLPATRGTLEASR